MLNECCRLSSKLVDNSSDLDEPDLDLPVVVNLETDFNMNTQSSLVPMVPHTGIAFVIVKNNKSNYSLQMLKSLLATWPILVLTLILTLIAGIIEWSLVSCMERVLFHQFKSKGTEALRFNEANAFPGFPCIFFMITGKERIKCCDQVSNCHLYNEQIAHVIRERIKEAQHSFMVLMRLLLSDSWRLELTRNKNKHIIYVYWSFGLATRCCPGNTAFRT